LKQFKTLVALVLALAMVLSLSTSALAAKITITDKSPEGTATTTFHYYGLLKATINGTAVAYYLDSPADDTLKGLLDAVTITKGGSAVDVFTFTKSADGTRWNVTVNSAIEDTDGEALSNALNTEAIKNAAFANNEFTMSSGKAEVDNLAEGYYLVTSSLGTNLVLDTLNTVEIATKNEYHTTVKTASKTNMEVGDIVTYTITVHVPETAQVDEYITVHDTLDDHLTTKTDTVVAKLGADTVALEDGTKKAATETLCKKFKITEAMLNKDVVITYDAELLSTAADDTGYVNTVFSNDDSYETNPSYVRVWTFDFDLDKNFADVTGDDAANYSATFELKDSDGNTITFIKDTTGYVKADSNSTGASATLTINGKDNINVRGLEAGTYTLTETATAPGYNLMTDTVAVTITDKSAEGAATDSTKTISHEVSYKIGTGDSATGTVTIVNNHGTELPSTGGIGTTIFYIAGLVLVLGAAAIVIARRKAEQ